MTADVKNQAAREFRSALERARRADILFKGAVYGCSILFLLIVVGIFIELVMGSRQAMGTFGLSFLWTSSWNPVTSQFGALPLIYGTVVSSGIGIVLAAGIGILAAAYLAEFAPGWLSRPLSFTIELLAAVPSVVFGLWGLFVLAPLMRNYVDRSGNRPSDFYQYSKDRSLERRF